MTARCLPWLLLSAGCYGDVIHVQARVTDEQKLDLLAAADLWNRELEVVDPGRRIDFDFNPGAGNQLVLGWATDDCSHTYQYSPFEAAVDGHSQTITINLNCPIPFQDRVSHELGHFLGMKQGTGYDGLGHIPPEEGVMSPWGYGAGDVPHGLSCNDVRLYCTVHACVARPMACE